MNLYRTSVAKDITADGLPDVRTYSISWQGSQAEASAVRAAAVRDGAKRKDVETEAVDVPTDKAGLLAFLNTRGVA